MRTAEVERVFQLGKRLVNSGDILFVFFGEGPNFINNQVRSPELLGCSATLLRLF